MPFSYGTPYTIKTNANAADYYAHTGVTNYSWHGSAPFAYGANDRYVLTNNVDLSGTPALLGLAMFKSSDKGQTWAEVDNANRPTGPSGQYQMVSSWCYDETATGVWISYRNASGHLCLIRFAMDTGGLWGAEFDSGITPGNGTTSFPVVRANGDVVVVYNLPFSAGANFVVFNGSWSSPVALSANYAREPHSGVLDASTGRIWIVGKSAGGFTYCGAINSDNSVAAPGVVSSATFNQPGGKVALLSGELYVGGYFEDTGPMSLDLDTRVGVISGTSASWSGASVSIATPSAPTSPTAEWVEENWSAGAYVGPDASNAEGIHLNPAEWVYQPSGSAEFYGTRYCKLQKVTASGNVTNSSGSTLHETDNSIFVVCASRYPSGDIGIVVDWVDNLLGGFNLTDDSKLIYIALAGAGSAGLSANRWYAI
jgi:hypothetical protein